MIYYAICYYYERKKKRKKKEKKRKKKRKNRKKEKMGEEKERTTKRTAEGGEGTGENQSRYLESCTSPRLGDVASRCSPICLLSQDPFLERGGDPFARSVCLIEDDCFFGARFSALDSLRSAASLVVYTLTTSYEFVRSLRHVCILLNREDDHGGYCAKGMTEEKQRFAPCR